MTAGSTRTKRTSLPTIDSQSGGTSKKKITKKKPMPGMERAVKVSIAMPNMRNVVGPNDISLSSEFRQQIDVLHEGLVEAQLLNTSRILSRYTKSKTFNMKAAKASAATFLRPELRAKAMAHAEMAVETYVKSRSDQLDGKKGA